MTEITFDISEEDAHLVLAGMARGAWYYEGRDDEEAQKFWDVRDDLVEQMNEQTPES